MRSLHGGKHVISGERLAALVFIIQFSNRKGHSTINDTKWICVAHARSCVFVCDCEQKYLHICFLWTVWKNRVQIQCRDENVDKSSNHRQIRNCNKDSIARQIEVVNIL